MRTSLRLVALPLAATFLLLVTGCASDAQPDDPPPSSTEAAASFDAEYAAELGADAYGMRRYVLALLKSGPNRDQDSTAAAELQQAHMENIRRLGEEGKLLLAGPFLDDGPLRGVYVFDVETVEEARALTETDPAVQAGRLEMELHPWYGSAALMEIGEIHERISRQDP